MAKLTISKIMKAAQADAGIGFCVKCGTRHTQVEPDARKYTCRKCGLPKVYGAEELLMMVGV